MENTVAEMTTTEQALKAWYAPQMHVVDVADETEGGLFPGNDGAGTSTLS
ncbi:MAG: hypothetical protein WAO71_03235 [Gallionella sp.]